MACVFIVLAASPPTPSPFHCSCFMSDLDFFCPSKRLCVLAGGSIHVTIAPVNFIGLVKGRL